MLPPGQNVVMPLIVGVVPVLVVKVKASVAVQSLASVTVTLYVPAIPVLMLCPNEPVDHSYCANPAPALKVVELPTQILALPDIVTEVAGFCVTTTEVLPVQPPASVTVTLYVPVPLAVMLCVVAKVDQLYCANPPPASNIVLSPAQLLRSPPITGFKELLRLTVTDALPVQPAAFVTVTA